MDLKIAARMIAVLALGAGLTAAIAALRDGSGSEDAPAIFLRDPGGEPAFAPVGRRSELARCRDIGAAALEDAACRKAWAENRRRFFRAEQPKRPPMPKPERFGKPFAASSEGPVPDKAKAGEPMQPDAGAEAPADNDADEGQGGRT
jgi:conjugative transfer region protein TrbK